MSFESYDRKETPKEVKYKEYIKSGIKKTDNYFFMPVSNIPLKSLSTLGKILMFPINVAIFIVSSLILKEQIENGVREYKKKAKNKP